MSLTLQSSLLYRLYGTAVGALLVGYASGFWTLAAGSFPWGVAAMGIVSNLGAGVLLALRGTNRKLKRSAVFFLLIALGLIIAAALSGL